MKIAQVVCTFPPYMAGTGNVCYHNSLELAKRGHDVTVFTSRFPDVSYAYPDLIKVKRLKPLFQIGNALLMPQLLQLKNFDIVHLHCPFIFGAEIILLNSKLRKNTLVVTYEQDLLFSGWCKHFIEIHNRLVEEKVLLAARKILLPTLDYISHSSMRRVFEERKEDVVELPHGVDINKFNPDVSSHELRQKYRIEDDEKIILFVGALDKAHRFKGVDILLKAFSKLLCDGKVVLLIVGEGSLKQSYQKIAGELGILDKITFAGSISDEELPRHYSLCDFLILPSVSRAEIFGLVLVEAMATGKSVIASNLPGVRTVVDEGKNGLLVEPGNIDDLTSKMQYLVANESIRERFGKEARKKVEDKYSWDKIGEKLEKVYLEALS